MLQKCLNFFKKPKVRNFLIYLFFVLSAVSCFCTYLLFSNVDLYNRSSKAVISILYFDIAFILMLLLLGSNKIIELWANRKNKGSRLTLRLISIFSLLSIVPSVMMCIFSALFFHNGIESWFNERNRVVLQESLSVAESYLAEHKRTAENDCLAIAKTLEYHLEKVNFEDNYPKLSKEVGFLLDDLCGLKGISSAILLDSNLGIVAHSKYSVNLHFLNINYQQIQKLESLHKKSITLDTEAAGQKTIIAASSFKNLNDYMFLIIEKNIDSDILSQAKNTRNAYNEYYQLLEGRNSLEIAFILMFLIVGILLLIASIAVAIVYSWKIVKPVSNLIDVSEDIIKGNLKARAKVEGPYEEIRLLSKTFNQMVEQVHDQQEDLVNINKRLDERMKFTSSVLAGVSSGVIGIDNNSIYIWNSAAEKLLGESIIFGEHIGNIMPEIVPLLRSIDSQHSSVEKEVQFKKDNNILLFLIKIENIASESDSRFVVTFDDLTNMVMAQRKAAWSEVARRVAHEIKNPLTPIQLSAERIRRKYMPQISTDAETFSELVNVIIRQVGDIKRLIDEFNFFARLPEPVLKECDLCEICKQAVFFMQNASNDVNIFFEHNVDSCRVKVDERLVHQSIVNLIQNSMNALSTTIQESKIWVSVQKELNSILILVEDNGPGLPKEKMESLATPYFTLMPKGTGLGLAIVKKIIQDHGGELLFGNSDHGGAKITISLPLLTEDKNEQ